MLYFLWRKKIPYAQISAFWDARVLSERPQSYRWMGEYRYFMVLTFQGS